MDYHIVKSGGVFELRQVRYKAYHKKGGNHPHDICAVGSTIDEVLSIYDKYLTGGVESYRKE